MAKLSSAQRNALPASKFAGPGRSFPVNDKVHAQKAIQLAPRAVKAGSITPAQETNIDAKARNVLGQNRPADPMKTTHNPANRLPLNTRHKPGSRGNM